MTRRGPHLYRAAVIIALLCLCGGVGVHSQDARGLRVVRSSQIKEIAGNEGRRIAVCIGINGYEHPEIQDLEKARNDATALAASLMENGQFDRVFLMTDEVDPRFDEAGAYPRYRNIRDRLSYLSDFLSPEDLVVFSFSGHGISDGDGNGYLLVSDTDYGDVFGTSLPMAELTGWLEENGVRKSLLLIDACRETVTEQTSRGFGRPSLKAQKFQEAEVSAVFYATRSGWYSYEDVDSDYGVFTKYVIQGVGGKADYQLGNGDGIVTFKELSTYVEEAVANYALALGLKQKPYTDIRGETFGDLALSAYSGSIDTGSRVLRTGAAGTVAGTSGGAAADGSRGGTPEREGFGSVRIYSNVDGTIRLDGSRKGVVAAGGFFELERITGGSHFVEIGHDYGTYRGEVIIEPDAITEISNLVVDSVREIRTMGGLNFVYVRGLGGGIWFGETEVPYGAFAAFVEATGYRSNHRWDQFFRTNYDYYPVSGLSRDDCLAFAEWFSEEHGVAVDLPTLAEWRMAAASRDGGVYPWGDGWDPSLCVNANSRIRGRLPITGGAGPIQVQYFVKDITLDGVTNLAGNVREWCSDGRVAGGRPLAAIAGGGWAYRKPSQFENEYVVYKPPYQAFEDVGFRLVIRE